MPSNTFFVEWDGIKYYTSDEVFSPKQSSIGILDEIYHASKFFDKEIPIIDLCCGIGSIGIGSYLKYPNIFSYYLGLDNDYISIQYCHQNILLHAIKGEALLWEAGDKIPNVPMGIAVCNPPFLLSKQHEDKLLPKQSFVFGGENGTEVLLKCFQSVKGTGHTFILKSFFHQVDSISANVSDCFSIVKLKKWIIKKDFILAFSTWEER